MEKLSTLLNISGRKLFLLPLISSLLIILSFPHRLWPYIVFISLIPLFLSIMRSKDFKEAFSLGAIFGSTFSAFCAIPLYHSLKVYNHGAMAFLLIAIGVILPYGAFCGLFSLAAKFWFHNKKFILAAALWVIIDYLKEILPLFIPYGFLADTLAMTPFIQLADISGVYGVTFIILYINILLTNFIITKRRQPLITAVIIMIISTLYGIYMGDYYRNIENRAPHIKAFIVQGNTDSVERWNELTSFARYQKYINLSQRGADTDLLLWPETVLNSSDRVNFDIMERASSLLKSNALFVTGGVRRNSKDENFNSIFLLKARELKFIYDKKILFPYSETPLFGFTAGPFYNSPDRFVKGKTPSSSAIDGIVYAFSICFENLYPSEIRQRMKFSDILITVANDSWFGETEEPYMQVYSTISRAVENRRSIIRAANTGISLCVAPSGDILTQSELNQEATLSAALPLIKNKGLFSRTGNIIIILFSLIIIADLIKREFLKTT